MPEDLGCYLRAPWCRPTGGTAYASYGLELNRREVGFDILTNGRDDNEVGETGHPCLALHVGDLD